jgi:hypothetical protein
MEQGAGDNALFFYLHFVPHFYRTFYCAVASTFAIQPSFYAVEPVLSQKKGQWQVCCHDFSQSG